jgi:uncharacterized protein YcbK (DUF882 family)
MGQSLASFASPLKRRYSVLCVAAALFTATTPATPASPAKQPPNAPNKGAKKPVRPGPKASTNYRSHVEQWHKAEREPVADPSGRPLLTLHAINTNETLSVPPLGDGGGFRATDLDRIARLLRDTRTGNEHPMDVRTIDAIYRIQAHFSAGQIRIVSGYRTPRGGNSNHGKGRAVDIIVPGVSDDDVAKFARSFGFVGVGVYPRSGFVHIDVRTRSYFWIDSSSPGRRTKERPILPDLAKEMDRMATSRGELPPPSLALSFDVDAYVQRHDEDPSEGDDEHHESP